jgi:hypothetical protein
MLIAKTIIRNNEIFLIALFDFGFEFVGRLVGEHVHCGSLTFEEVTDDIHRDSRRGLEIVTRHIAEDGVAQLPGNGGWMMCDG